MIEFLAANWLWIVFIAAMLAMHRSGMGCGSHGGHGTRHGETDESSHGTTRLGDEVRPGATGDEGVRGKS